MALTESISSLKTDAKVRIASECRTYMDAILKETLIKKRMKYMKLAYDAVASISDHYEKEFGKLTGLSDYSAVPSNHIARLQGLFSILINSIEFTSPTAHIIHCLFSIEYVVGMPIVVNQRMTITAWFIDNYGYVHKAHYGEGFPLQDKKIDVSQSLYMYPLLKSDIEEIKKLPMKLRGGYTTYDSAGGSTYTHGEEPDFKTLKILASARQQARRYFIHTLCVFAVIRRINKDCDKATSRIEDLRAENELIRAKLESVQ